MIVGRIRNVGVLCDGKTDYILGRAFARRFKGKNKDKYLIPEVPYYVYDLIRSISKFKKLGLMKRIYAPSLPEEEKQIITQDLEKIGQRFVKSEHLKAGKIKPIEYEYKDPPPYPHQRIGTSLLIMNPFYALFCEQGTGKTRMAIDALCYLCKRYGFDKYGKVLIAAPNSVLQSGWANDFKKFATVDFRLFLAITDNKEKVIQDWINAKRDALNVLLIGYDFLWRLFPNLLPEKELQQAFPESFIKVFVSRVRRDLTHREKREKLKKEIEEKILPKAIRTKTKKILKRLILLIDLMNEVDIVIADESQRIKTFSAKRSRAFRVISMAAKRKYILSGTPITNTPIDIVSQALFLHPFFFASQKAFKDYFVDTVRKGQWEDNKRIRPDKKSEFNELLNSFSLIVKKSDVLKDLPDKIFLERDVYLSDKTSKVYLQMAEEFVVETEALIKDIESGKIKQNQVAIYAQNILAQMSKLRQITSGFLKTEDKIAVIGDEKIETTLEVLEEIGDQSVVIWGNFTFEIERLVEVLKKKKYSVDYIIGSTPIKERNRIISDFQNGNLQILVANPATLATGVTLTKASNAIYYSLSFKLEDWLQSQDRIHRIGQKANSVNYYVLLSQLSNGKQTIDHKIYKALKMKDNISKEVVKFAKQIVEDLKEMLKKH